MNQTAAIAVDCRCRLGEGISWWPAHQALLWTDIEAKRLWIRDAGGVRNWPVAARLCSMTPCASGALLLGFEHGLVRADFDIVKGPLDLTPLVEIEAGLPDTRINDGRTDRVGNFVFGTMSQTDGHPARGSFYQWSAQHRLRRLDLPSCGIANSICFSPDGETMYFCDSPRGQIMACRYDTSSAAVSEIRVFTAVGPSAGKPDGSTVDAEGCLWNAAWGAGRLRRYRPDGSFEREVMVPAKNPTCLVFAGAALNELFVTTAREEMSPEELERTPDAGGIYRAAIEGVRGLQDAAFADIG